MILAGLLTVALLLYVMVMVWRCWNLPPVPVIRWWALGGSAMTVAVIAQVWRAELWRKRYYRLEEQFLRLSPPQVRSRKTLFPKPNFLDAGGPFLGADVRCVLPCVAEVAGNHPTGSPLDLKKSRRITRTSQGLSTSVEESGRKRSGASPTLSERAE